MVRAAGVRVSPLSVRSALRRQLRPKDVWEVIKAARGRCAHCGSLTVERRPSYPDGSPAPWEHL